MTAAQEQQQSGPDPSSVAHAGAVRDAKAETPDWVLQTIMELRGAVGELVGTQKALTTTVEKQSGKTDDLRGALTASIENQSSRIDALRSELTASIGDQAKLAQTASQDLAKLTGAISFAKWAAGICIALFTALVGLTGLVVYRLPEVIEAVLRALRGSASF